MNQHNNSTVEIALAMCESFGEDPREEGKYSEERWKDFVPAAIQFQTLMEGRKHVWREAVINELLVQGIYSLEHESNPWKAVRDMIQWEVDVALDPRVSKAARDLIVSHGGFTSEPGDDTLDIPENKSEGGTNGST